MLGVSTSVHGTLLLLSDIRNPSDRRRLRLSELLFLSHSISRLRIRAAGSLLLCRRWGYPCPLSRALSFARYPTHHPPYVSYLTGPWNASLRSDPKRTTPLGQVARRQRAAARRRRSQTRYETP